jgi:hypothetical protein
MKIFTRIALIVMLSTGVGLTFASTAYAPHCCFDNGNECCVGACCWSGSTWCESGPCPV